MRVVAFSSLFLVVSCGAEGVRNELNLSPKSIYEQCNIELPSSVLFSVREDGKQEITIKGISIGQLNERDMKGGQTIFSQTPLDYVPPIPELVSSGIDHVKSTLTFVTSRKLMRYEISAAIDKASNMRSDIPCWAELEARDFKRAADYHNDRYVVKMVDGEAPSSLAWFWLLGSKGINLPFAVTRSGQLGQLLINPAPVPLGSRPHYTMRVLDYEKRITWIDTTTAFGHGRIAICDYDGDGLHEIYVESYDDKVAKIFHIKPASLIQE